ncbi:hypothetical protein XA68_10739 [Ophiocordyceps unilateralis]|uniref:Uncharacterized protein n=1 Tax=Ophiocordyceps unilateralis TaxID=268505 RepID=A0A2A9PI28_OPHUN|nr:hypothetical protein XA68_10739 [Ophiocordyceps unilateralis]
MLLLKLLAVAPILISASAIPLTESTNATTRDVIMDIGNGPEVKYRKVPATYTAQDIKHADLVGMMQTYVDGETWLTLNGKRLFLMPEDAADPSASSELASNWPVMKAEELREALAKFPPYKDVHAQWMDVATNLTLTKRTHSGCLRQTVGYNEAF